MNINTEKERQAILAKALGKKIAVMVIGGVSITFSDENELVTTTTITIKNEITGTTFVYVDKHLYYDYFLIMKTLDDILHPIMIQYRKYVNALFYKRTETDKNTIKKWIHDNHNDDTYNKQ